MKSFLIPIGGSDTDGPLFETALAAARPFSSHLQFLHVHVGPGQAAVNTPHTGFAMGPALVERAAGISTPRRRPVRRLAAQHFRDFCAGSGSRDLRRAGPHQGVTASWHEEDGHALKRIMFRARHNDLVVVGRAKTANGLPADFLEQLLVGCGRPVLIAGSAPTQTPTGTIMVCWKESRRGGPRRQCRDAVSHPRQARRHRERRRKRRRYRRGAERRGASARLERHSRRRYGRSFPNGKAIPGLLSSAAQDCGADLVVLGAYGRSRMHEMLFGSCTQSVISNADRPVLLMH